MRLLKALVSEFRLH
jgi:hypothetical protein